LHEDAADSGLVGGHDHLLGLARREHDQHAPDRLREVEKAREAPLARDLLRLRVHRIQGVSLRPEVPEDRVPELLAAARDPDESEPALGENASTASFRVAFAISCSGLLPDPPAAPAPGGSRALEIEPVVPVRVISARTLPVWAIPAGSKSISLTWP